MKFMVCYAGSKESKKALEDLKVTHDICMLYQPQTNGVAERAVRKVKEGTSCTLVQSEWHDYMWAEAMSCFCFYEMWLTK